MDNIDKKLIAALEKNARIPIKQMAQEVFLSSPAVSARIERLEKIGVISGYRAVLDIEKLGFHITAFVNLAMVPEKKESFYQLIKNHPNVMECYHVTGPYSMLLKACFRGTPELDSFVGQLQKFGKTQTQVVFSTVVDTHGIVKDESKVD